MRKIAFIVISLLFALPLSAQSLDRDRAKSVYRQYDFEAPRTVEAAPEGYAPIYISHYGRHGARHLYTNAEYELLYSTLAAAHEADALTEVGERVWACVSELYPHFKGRGADLTQYGQWQHRTLAERMCKDFPELFGAEPSVFALSSVKPRCIMSMSAFCTSLAKHSNAKIVTDVNTSAMPVFVPYQQRFNPQYNEKDSDWRTHVENFFGKNFDKDAFYKRLFKKDSFRKSIADEMKFAQTLYYFDAHLGGTDFADHTIGYAFTDEEYRTLYDIDNIKFFLRRGWGIDKECNRSVFYAKETVQDILDKAEEDLASGQKRLRLRFGHDGALALMLAFLEVDSWGKRVGSIDKIDTVWQTSNITMASNFRLVFYSNGKDILVKAQFNENDVRLALKPTHGVFYRWDDLKKYLTDKVEKATQTINNKH